MFKEYMWFPDLLGTNGTFFFGGEKQSEQVIQQSIPQQNEVGWQETTKIIVITWTQHDKQENELKLILSLIISSIPHNTATLELLLPPSSFSSLLISMTTNFSHTAKVGRVEEMNCPKLWSQWKHQALAQSYAFCMAITQMLLPQ